jgi:hypothetical protein
MMGAVLHHLFCLSFLTCCHSLFAVFSIAFSEASRDTFGSPRGIVENSQRTTRDICDADLDSASINEALAACGPGNNDRTGSTGNMRSSADYKMLIAKADALLEQFASQSAGLHS